MPAIGSLGYRSPTKSVAKSPLVAEQCDVTIHSLTHSRHWAVTLMSAYGSNIKQLAFTPLDSKVTSDLQLSMGSAPDQRHTFVPWLVISEETLL
ncbi:hypothetical protein TNCV_1844241 [Trichonephila clavipes]|nr:hypothetical protein TNCV_1844241 [Trichonephila clavipes]